MVSRIDGNLLSFGDLARILLSEVGYGIQSKFTEVKLNISVLAVEGGVAI